MSQPTFNLEQIEQMVVRAAEIRDARAHLLHLVENWNKDYPGIAVELNIGMAKAPPEDDGSSIDDKIVRHLDANPERMFNANMLHDELGIPPSSLGTQLSKLYRMSKIVRLGRGYYTSLNSSNKEINWGGLEKEAT